MKRWVPRAAVGVYAMFLLAATVRAWLKIDVDAAGKVLGLGLVFGIVIWRAWSYILAIVFGRRSQFSRR
jgi:hypothetical protein